MSASDPDIWDSFDIAMMKMALQQAELAMAESEVPVGAVLTMGESVIAKARNAREVNHDPLGHAEALVIRKAAETLGTWRLTDASLYVTLEPCLMCAGAILGARVKRVVFGALDDKAGAVRSLYRVFEDERLNHQVDTSWGLYADVSTSLLRDFFKHRRHKIKPCC